MDTDNEYLTEEDSEALMSRHPHLKGLCRLGMGGTFYVAAFVAQSAWVPLWRTFGEDTAALLLIGIILSVIGFGIWGIARVGRLIANYLDGMGSCQREQPDPVPSRDEAQAILDGWIDSHILDGWIDSHLGGMPPAKSVADCGVRCSSVASSVSGAGMRQTLWLFTVSPSEVCADEVIRCLQINATRIANECANLPYGKCHQSRDTWYLVLSDNEKIREETSDLHLAASQQTA